MLFFLFFSTLSIFSRKQNTSIPHLKVKDIEPFINYCKENNYELINKTAQKRVLYRNSNKILARVTIIEDDKSKNIFLDFKDENESDDVLKISRESGKINVTNVRI